MSGYFVHGGTQYPYTQPNSQQSQNSGNQSFFGNTSYPPQTGGGQPSHFSSSSSGGNSNNSFQSGFNSNQYNNAGNSSTSGNSYGSSNPSAGSGFSSNTSFNSGPSSFSGNNTNKPSNFNSSYNFNKGSTGNNNNYNTGQGTQSSYEKALFNAANQYYSNRARGGRGMRGGQGRGRGGRGSFTQNQSHHQQQPQNTGPKPIKATEIKAFLYAWCGQRKLKPEYEVVSEGEPKKISFSCQLRVPGLDYVAKIQATNKKDSQSKAAWDFCENMVKMGYMKQTELPSKPVDPVPKSASGETTQQLGSLPPETQETIDENGGWSLSNSRQRLNQFCQREHTTPIFKHTILGPEHLRSFTCELSIFVNAVQKEFVSSETGANKRQSTAICALSMVRQLYKANLIEKHGDTMKHVTRGGLLTGKKVADQTAKPDDDTPMSVTSVATGQKRKADDTASSDQVDENGNWTVDNSRQRLNQFCQAHNIPCDVIYEEEGIPGSRTYTASLNLKVKPDESAEEKELTASAKGQSKKVAAQGCALMLLSQLYKLTLVEASPNSSNAPNKKKIVRQRLDQAPTGMRMPPYTDYGPAQFAPFTLGFGHTIPKKTTLQDQHLNEKHRLIYPTENELVVVQRSVRTIEQALKDVADLLVTPEPEGEKTMEMDDKAAESTTKKSKLQGVMRVGSLAKGLLLKGDLNVQLVLLCPEAPTAKLLVKVAQLLPKHIKASEGDTFSVVTAMQAAAISVTNKTVKTETEAPSTCTITVSLTSPVVRTPTEEAAKDPPGSLNKEKCLQALAELRHAKWFQACANVLPSCVVVIRIMREMTRRLKEWKPLSDWALELIVEKALATSPVPLSLGGSFLRCLELISSGLLLPGGPGISDPCERTEADAAGNMTNQERETLTYSAQDFLRKIYFYKLHMILDIAEIEKRVFVKKINETPASTETSLEN